MSDKWERFKAKISKIVETRVVIVILLFCITSGILIQKIFYLQIVI